jgi:hypothetical protein
MTVDQRRTDRGTAWPEVILPGQYFRRQAMTAEQRLMLAVLEDGLNILLKPTRLERRAAMLRAETEQWLLSDDTTWPFAFLNVCHALDLDAGGIRRRVLESPGVPRHVRPAA